MRMTTGEALGRMQLTHRIEKAFAIFGSAVMTVFGLLPAARVHVSDGTRACKAAGMAGGWGPRAARGGAWHGSCLSWR